MGVVEFVSVTVGSLSACLVFVSGFEIQWQAAPAYGCVDPLVSVSRFCFVLRAVFMLLQISIQEGVYIIYIYMHVYMQCLCMHGYGKTLLSVICTCVYICILCEHTPSAFVVS